MPIYEYRCRECQKDFEKFQKISDDPLESCPDCGGRVERLISQTSFSLKGGGWYKDGYSSTAGKSTKKTSQPKAGKEEKKPAKKDKKDT